MHPNGTWNSFVDIFCQYLIILHCNVVSSVISENKFCFFTLSIAQKLLIPLFCRHLFVAPRQPLGDPVWLADSALFTWSCQESNHFLHQCRLHPNLVSRKHSLLFGKWVMLIYKKEIFETSHLNQSFKSYACIDAKTTLSCHWWK